MSNESGGVAGSDDGGGNLTRVGTAEREEAVALLTEHWQTGRLDPGEHERRVTRAREAVTRADLDALFADLPQAGEAQVSSAAVQRRGISRVRDTIMGLTPFAAVFVFFMTGNWLCF